MRPLLVALVFVGCEPIRTGTAVEPRADAGPSLLCPVVNLDGECAEEILCLDTAVCDPSGVDTCGIGVHGRGDCLAGRCNYTNEFMGCVEAADCPCGLCADRFCAEDLAGGCGVCSTTTSTGNATRSSLCTSCLASCTNFSDPERTKPFCCMQKGCLCEGPCEGYE
jgi:hypothetical protein